MKHRMVLVLALAALVGCGHKLPPAAQLMHPGPGVGGPGPGVIPPMMGGGMGGGACMDGGMAGIGGVSQLHFVGPEGMHIQWDFQGDGQFASEPLVAPARYNFSQGALYRLKVSQIPGYEGVELYPTIEVGPALPRTAAYIEHNAIPVQFTQEDIDQVLSGNFVTKVIYLPDAEYQELAIAGVETLVSTRLDPGVDPIVEADRRGSILGIVRIGNKLIENVAGDEMGVGGGAGGGGGYCPGAGYGGMPNGYPVAQYGMPITGTPIGLPGPPHIPLGHPAGLQKHVMKNHTHVHMPPPTEKVKITAKHMPGYSYPRPANKVNIWEFGNGGMGAHGGQANAGANCPY